jgi:hypothetical protein
LPWETTRAGLLRAVPGLVSLDLPALTGQAGYPGTRAIPGICWLLSLLALTLTRTRRVCHAGDLLNDPAAALFAGMAVLPKKSALTAYSYRLSHDHQQKFLAARDKQVISSGLAARRRSSTWTSTPSGTGDTPGQIITTPDAVTVRLERRALSPVLRKAQLPPATPVPRWAGRPIRYEIT